MCSVRSSARSAPVRLGVPLAFSIIEGMLAGTGGRRVAPQDGMDAASRRLTETPGQTILRRAFCLPGDDIDNTRGDRSQPEFAFPLEATLPETSPSSRAFTGSAPRGRPGPLLPAKASHCASHSDAERRVPDVVVLHAWTRGVLKRPDAPRIAELDNLMDDFRDPGLRCPLVSVRGNHPLATVPRGPVSRSRTIVANPGRCGQGDRRVLPIRSGTAASWR